jgi:hypothetical protein
MEDVGGIADEESFASWKPADGAEKLSTLSNT